jgi:hypothetical protein
MRAELGDAYTTLLRKTYEGRVPGGADLVCYWFDKARAQMAAGQLQRAGLVTTNSIRGGANRKVLDAICAQTRIFEAWSDEPWVNDGRGACAGVSLVLSPAPTTPPSASCTAASTNSGRCAWAPRWKTGRATPPPPASKPSPSPQASPRQTPRTSAIRPDRCLFLLNLATGCGHAGGLHRTVRAAEIDQHTVTPGCNACHFYQRA